MKLIDIYRDYDVTLHDCLLKHITKEVQNFKLEEVVEALEFGYNNQDPNASKIATLMNSIFTHHAQTFMLTKRSFGDLIKKDTNSYTNSINGTEYKLILSLMINSNHFQCLRHPKGRRSGVYKVVQPNLVNNLHRLHSKEWFNIQEDKVCSFYDNKDKPSVESSEDLNSADLMRENMREKGYDI